MERRFRTNTKWAIMDFETFKNLSAKTIDETIRKNAQKRANLKKSAK